MREVAIQPCAGTASAFPDEESSDLCLDHLRARGVLATFHYVPLHSSPFGRTLSGDLEFGVTDRVARGLLRLPLHPLLTDDDVDRVVESVLAFPA